MQYHVSPRAPFTPHNLKRIIYWIIHGLIRLYILNLKNFVWIKNHQQIHQDLAKRILTTLRGKINRKQRNSRPYKQQSRDDPQILLPNLWSIKFQIREIPILQPREKYILENRHWRSVLCRYGPWIRHGPPWHSSWYREK